MSAILFQKRLQIDRFRRFILKKTSYFIRLYGLNFKDSRDGFHGLDLRGMAF